MTALMESVSTKERTDTEQAEFRETIIKIDAGTNTILAEMHEGFNRMDIRFEAVDKRFEDMHRQSTMIFRFITIGIVILGLITTLFQVI